jgi:hypothetical protein
LARRRSQSNRKTVSISKLDRKNNNWKLLKSDGKSRIAYKISPFKNDKDFVDNWIDYIYKDNISEEKEEEESAFLLDELSDGLEMDKGISIDELSKEEAKEVLIKYSGILKKYKDFLNFTNKELLSPSFWAKKKYGVDNPDFLVVFRFAIVNEGEKFELKENIGTHWTWNPEESSFTDVYDVWNAYMFVAKVNKDDIDWKSTFLRQLGTTRGDELELIIPKGKEIEILALDFPLFHPERVPEDIKNLSFPYKALTD